MSTQGRTAAADGAGDLAGAVREAEFVALVAAADGDALAAAGLLARGCRAVGVPFQASVARTDAERGRRLADGDALGVLVGATRGAADHTVAGAEEPASVTAHAVTSELGADPAPALSLSGAYAAGVSPGAGPTAGLLEQAADAGVTQRPGVGLPVDDVVDGLAHQSLVHADFAGDADAAAALAADAGFDPDCAAASDATGETRERLASLFALEAAGDERATARTADAVQRALRPHATPDGPFATVEGHADVLRAVAREAPGTGVALALDGGARDAALSAWRDHGRAAQAAVRSATTARYDGLFVARLEEPAPVETVARLVLTARSPEPAVLAVDEGEAAAVADTDADLDAGVAMRGAVESVGGEAAGDPTRAYATHDAETRAFVSAFRGVDG
jgi:hypothetical protein